jgi:hypothetical protein
MANATTPPAATPEPEIFGNNRVLLYNVSPWNALGFGVPNFGNVIGTLNHPIWRFVDEVGRDQLFIMTRPDAQLSQPPTADTVVRICKLVNRAQVILANRQKDPMAGQLSAGKAQMNQKIWNIHPVPYFDGPMLTNSWLKEYNNLVMVALMNAMQHSDNGRALAITQAFAQQIWQYFREIKILVGSELLTGLDPAILTDDTKMLPAALPLTSYNPSAVVVNTEDLQSPPNPFSQPTNMDLHPFYNGIPANLIIPNLVQYPVGSISTLTGASGTTIQDAIGLAGLNAVVPAGGNMVPGGITPAAKAVIDAVKANIQSSLPAAPASPASVTPAQPTLSPNQP